MSDSGPHRTPDSSPWITRFAPLVVPGGTVLDIASGAGRHARFFHACGHEVAAVDRDISGLQDLEGASGFEIIEADLEAAPWPLGDRTFAGIVVANYLHRPLFPRLIAALGPDGVLLYETFAQGNERYGRPRNPDFLLQPGELIEVFGSRLHIVAFEHGRAGGDHPRVVQRICAVNPGECDIATLQL
jgi:SAM-dependent methyltransferase